MVPDRSVWIPTHLYPADGRLRLLLIAPRSTSPDRLAAVPAVGCRINHAWHLSRPFDGLHPVDPTLVVVGWQPIHYERHSGITEDDLRESFKSMVRLNKHGSPLAGDAVGWFRHMTAPLVAELVKLRTQLQDKQP